MDLFLDGVRLSGDMTLRQMFELHFKHYLCLNSKTTNINDLSIFKVHIKDTELGAMKIKDITFLHLQKWANNMLSKNYAVKTVKNINAKIRVVLKTALGLGLIEKNPAEFVRFPKFDNHVYLELNLAQQKQLIEAIVFNTDKYNEFFYFLLHGRRKSEALNLEWRDIDFAAEIYRIRSQINKARRAMSYYLTPSLADKFKALKQRQQQIGIKTDFVFCNEQTGMPLNDLRKAWRRLLKKTGLPHMRLHDIRHLLATYSINHRHLSLESVAATLGHCNLSTTQIYVTRQQQLSQKVMTDIFASIGQVEEESLQDKD